MLLTDHGFSLSATRASAMWREDPERLVVLFASVTLIKLAFFALGGLVLAAVLVLISRFGADWPLYAVIYLSVLDSVMFPVWLYQGLERMRPITVVTVLARMLWWGGCWGWCTAPETT